MSLSFLSWLRRLYSLDTLDTRFTVPANVPVKIAAEDTRSGSAKDARSNAVTNSASPPRWATLEFYVYYMVFIVAVPLMFKTVIDVSQGASAWSWSRNGADTTCLRIASHLRHILSFALSRLDSRAESREFCLSLLVDNG